MRVEAGRTYRVVDETGEDLGSGRAERRPDGCFNVAGWVVTTDGYVPGTGCKAEALTDVGGIEIIESTADRHEADEQDMQHDGLPRLHDRRLAVRQLHALERIADALEVLTGTAMDAADAMGCGCEEPDADEGLPGEESVQ